MEIRKFKIPWSKTSIMHAWKLVFRSVFFLTAVGLYIYDKVTGNFKFLDNGLFANICFLVILGIYLIEMILRFFPNSIESNGCQKIFKRNYIEIEETKPYEYPKRKGVLLVLIIWILFNLIFGVLYWTHVIDEGILILLSLTYGICDMVCILFFCPFQTWFMKTKCCNTCTIYNWDFAMMFTPLIFIPHWVTWILAGTGLASAILWEIKYHLYKERFYEVSNGSLHCENCKEKLCTHKKQLQSLLIKIREEIEVKSAAKKANKNNREK